MLKNVEVKEWMSSPPVTAEHNMAIMDAHQLMKDKNVRRLPVVKKGKLVGMVTIGDVREVSPSYATTLTVWEMNYLISKLTLEEVMTKNPYTINLDEPIQKAAKIMLENKVSGLPVVNKQGDLVGIITESDIFRMVVSSNVEITIAD